MTRWFQRAKSVQLLAGILSWSACASSQPKEPRTEPRVEARVEPHVEPHVDAPVEPRIEPRSERHPCDENREVRVDSRPEAGAIVLEQRLTTGFCSTPTTRVQVLGRIVLPAAPSDRCPIGALVLRAWDHGDNVELPALVESLDGDTASELRSHFQEFTGDGRAEAYLLGCPRPGRADFVFVRTDIVDPAPRVELFVGNGVKTSDRRFVRPAP